MGGGQSAKKNIGKKFILDFGAVELENAKVLVGKP